jgi:hypothetical protein
MFEFDESLVLPMLDYHRRSTRAVIVRLDQARPGDPVIAGSNPGHSFGSAQGVLDAPLSRSMTTTEFDVSRQGHQSGCAQRRPNNRSMSASFNST